MNIWKNGSGRSDLFRIPYIRSEKQEEQFDYGICGRSSVNSVSMVNDVRVLNRVFSRVSGKIAVIGSSVVWSDTMLYKMIQEDFDVVRVK